MSMSRITAFTLIELLIVIAIIAALAAILFPVFEAAKDSANRTTALSNVNQIGLAAQLYLNDNDDTLPFRFPIQPTWPGYDPILFAAGNGGYSTTLGPYLRSQAGWFSPDDRLPNKGYTSFAFNEQLAFAWTISTIPRPAEAIYLTDRTDIYTTPSGPYDTYVWWQFTDTMPFTESSLPGIIDPVVVASQIDPIRYNGTTAAYLFLDSHVAALTFYRTWGDANRNLHLATKS
jgi:prepilin-type N-terminal cleavage/methylation domain-containing protein